MILLIKCILLVLAPTPACSYSWWILLLLLLLMHNACSYYTHAPTPTPTPNSYSCMLPLVPLLIHAPTHACPYSCIVLLLLLMAPTHAAPTHAPTHVPTHACPCYPLLLMHTPTRAWCSNSSWLTKQVLVSCSCYSSCMLVLPAATCSEPPCWHLILEEIPHPSQDLSWYLASFILSRIPRKFVKKWITSSVVPIY
jgi:hypothetical protein